MICRHSRSPLKRAKLTTFRSRILYQHFAGKCRMRGSQQLPLLLPLVTLHLRTTCLSASLPDPGVRGELVLIQPAFPYLVHGVPRPFTSLYYMQEASKKSSYTTQCSLHINVTLGIIETNIPRLNFSVTKPDLYVLETFFGVVSSCSFMLMSFESPGLPAMHQLESHMHRLRRGCGVGF